jgi:hypothetical protein
MPYGRSPAMNALADMKRLQQLSHDDPKAYTAEVNAFVTQRLISQGVIDPAHGSSFDNHPS